MSEAQVKTTTATFLECGLLMAKQGVPVIPLLPRQKATIMDDWQNAATTDETTITKWNAENPESNCGAVAKQDGILIWDCDAAGLKDEVQLATGKTFSTFTVKSSGEKRHYYFKQTDSSRTLKNFKRKTKDGKELYSLRWNNAYCVSAGSTHPDGHLYSIGDDSPIVPAPEWLVQWWKDDLEKDTHSSGNGSFVMPETVSEGGRNDILFKLGCSLRSKGLAESVLIAAIEAANDEQCVPPLKDEEVKTIVHSVMKYPSGTSLSGTVILEDSSGATETTEMELEPSEDLLPEFTITGSIWDYAAVAEPSFPMNYKVMALITRIGLALSGRTFLQGEENLQPRFYTAFVSKAWTGKSSSIAATEFLDINDGLYAVSSSVDSSPALVDAFYEARDLDDAGKPVRLLLSADEVKSIFETSRTGRDGKGVNILTQLLTLYEGNKTGNNTRKFKDRQVRNAHLAVLGGATPDGYESMWVGSSGSKNGLQSRFTVISTNDGTVPVRRQPSDKETMKYFEEKIRSQIVRAPEKVSISEEAWAMLDSWGKEISSNEHSVRLVDVVKRLGMVLAVTNDTDTIDAILMGQTLSIGKHILAAREKFNPADSAGNVQAFEHRILKCVKKHSEKWTKREITRHVSPYQCAGGYEAFNRAWHGLKDAEAIGVTSTIGKRQLWGILT